MPKQLQIAVSRSAGTSSKLEHSIDSQALLQQQLAHLENEVNGLRTVKLLSSKAEGVVKVSAICSTASIHATTVLLILVRLQSICLCFDLAVLPEYGLPSSL